MAAHWRSRPRLDDEVGLSGLLIFTDISLSLINAIGMLVFALLVPYIAIGRTLLYFDLQVKAEEEPAKRWRERLPRRAAPAGAGVQPAP